MLNAVEADWSTFWGGRNSTPFGPDLASATTIAITSPIHKVTGTTQVDRLTIPWKGFKGVVIIWPTGAAAYTTGSAASGDSLGIAVTYTSVANRPFMMVCDGAQWTPMAIA